jgi:Mob1/phocein family
VESDLARTLSPSNHHHHCSLFAHSFHLRNSTISSRSFRQQLNRIGALSSLASQCLSSILLGTFGFGSGLMFDINQVPRRSMGRGKPSASNAKRSPEPVSSKPDPGNHLQAHAGPISPRIAPSLSSRSASQSSSNGYSTITNATSQQEEDESASHPKPLYLCSPFVEAALVKGNFKTIVMLPKYVDIMEWVAVNSEFRSTHVVLYL